MSPEVCSVCEHKPQEIIKEAITLETGRALPGAESLTTWMCIAGTFLLRDAHKNADKQCCWWEWKEEILCSGVRKAI